MVHADDGGGAPPLGGENPAAGGGLPPPPITGAKEEEEDKGPLTFDEENPFDWRTKFRTDAVSAVEKWAEEFGVSKFALDAYIRDNMQLALDYINKNVMKPNSILAGRINKFEGGGQSPFTYRGEQNWVPETPSDWDQIWQAGMAAFSMQLGFDLSSPPSKANSTGRGSRGPTAQEIRNMVDVDQLTDAANTIWQGWLVEDAPEARKLAKAYVDEVVRTKGENEIDFQTFITNKIKKTNRYGLIYQNKPDGVSEQQYLQPYVQSARQIMGGGQGQETAVSDVAVGGAALGASGDAFGARLNRTAGVQNSAGYISGLEDRVRGVSNLLRG